MEQIPRTEVWELIRLLTTSMIEAAQRIDTLAPHFPEELFEARDSKMEGLTVADYLNRLAEHSRVHRHELASIRAAIGRARPTDPGDLDPQTGEPYASVWYQWQLMRAFIDRMQMVGELIGLTDAGLDEKPSPELVAGNERSIREACEHVLHVQRWLLAGIEDGIRTYRERKQGG